MEPPPEQPKLSPFAICIPIGLFIINVAMVVGVLPQWMILYLCSRFTEPDPSPTFITSVLPGFFHTPALNPNPSWEVCSKLPNIQSMAATWVIVGALSSNIPSLLLGPFYGSLSDRIGRKPLFLLGMSSALMLLSSYLSVELFDFGLWILLFNNVIVGFMGGFMTLGTVMMTYFADTTTSANRNAVFVMGEAVLFGGFSIGPLIGGAIARNFSNGPFKVLLLSFTLNLCVLLGTALYLPESLKVKKQKTVLSIRSSLEGLYTLFQKVASPTFLALILAACLQSAATSGNSSFFYYLAYTFGWDALDEGQYILVMGVSRTVQMLLIFPLLNRVFQKVQSTKLGKAYFDLTVIRVGALVNVTAYLGFALATRGEYIYLISVWDSFAIIAGPILKSVLSLTVGGENQGLLFSGIGLLSQCVSLVSSVVFPNIWKRTIITQPNSFLLVVSALHLVAFLVLNYPSAKTIAECSSDEEVEAEEEVSLLSELTEEIVTEEIA